MPERKLATRYARALLAVLRDPAASEAADSFLSGLARSLRESPDLRASMLNPAIPLAAKTASFQALAESASVGPLVAKFLKTVVQNGRVGDLADIAEAFHTERERAAGIIPATVRSATPLDATALSRIRASLERLSGQRVRLEVSVDPSLLGGLVARMGSKVYDGSVRTQLAALRRKLVEE